MNPHRRIALMTLTILSFALASPSARADEASEAAALALAKRYAGDYEASRPGDALQYWDVETFCAIVFREDLDQYSPWDRKAIVDAMRRCLRGSMTQAQALGMRGVRTTGFETKPMGDGLVAVRFKAQASNGAPRAVTLVVRDHPQAGWRVVNIGLDGSMMAAGLRGEFLKSGQEPMVFATELARILEDPTFAWRPRIQSTRSALMTLRSQLELYALQHQDRRPTRAQLQDAWRPLTQRTDERGNVVTQRGGRSYGPYIESPPRNPFNGSITVAAPGQATPTTGWIYDERTWRLRAVVPATLRDAFDTEDAEFVPMEAMADVR